MTGQSPPELILRGIRATTAEALIDLAGSPRHWVISDLSRGAWRGHHVAREMAAELGVAPPATTAASSVDDFENGTQPAYADVVGTWIDQESAGDATVLRSLAWADRIFRASQDRPSCIFLVVVPADGEPWQRENVVFLSLLAARLRDTDTQLCLVTASNPEPALPAGWAARWEGCLDPRASEDEAPAALALVPGLLDAEILALFSDEAVDRAAMLLSVGRREDGLQLVLPIARPTPDSVSRLVYDRLAYLARDLPWLRAYGEYWGNNIHVAPFSLCREAWRRESEGGSGIAQRLLARAISCARSSGDRALLEAQLQGLRIGTRDYRAAGSIKDPSPAYPVDLKGFIHQTKGWGLAMTGECAAAEPHLAVARELLESRAGTREHLYLMNISALNQVKLGNANAAMEIELQIAKERSRRPRRDWHIEYVNCLNLARLESARGHFEAADRYYRQAFETSSGLRSTSDAVYANLCRARIEGARGSWQRAESAWLRAALAWLASPNPEALAPRAVLALVGSEPPTTWALETAVATALAEGLLEAAKRRGSKLHSAPTGHDSWRPTFTREESVAAETARAGSGVSVSGSYSGEHLCLGSDGWGVVLAGGQPTAEPARASSPEAELLESAVAAVIGEACPDSGALHFDRVIVDDCFGTELPTSFRELLDLCVRTRVGSVVFAGQRLALSPAVLTELERASLVRVAAGVDKLHLSDPRGGCVEFKRYRGDLELSSEEVAVIRRIGGICSLAELADSRDHSLQCDLKGDLQGELQIEPQLERVTSTLRSLECKRVVTLGISSSAAARLEESTTSSQREHST